MHSVRGFQSKKRVLLAATLCVILAQGFAGCSSSEMTEGEAPDALIPPPDAGTDAVPLATTETPAPAGDVPPPDVPPPVAETEVPPPAEAVPPVAETAQAETPAPGFDAASSETPPTTAADSGMTVDYTTQSGDTLMKVAFETYGDLLRWKEIYEANRDRISDPNRVPPGTVLKLERPATPVVIEKNGERYRIRRGDTLGKISRNLYGTPSKWRDIWENNRQLIKNPNKIYAGFDLYYRPMDGGQQTPTPLAGGPTPEAPVGETPREPATAN